MHSPNVFEREREVVEPFVTKYYSYGNAAENYMENDGEELQPFVIEGTDGKNILSGLLEKGQKLRDNMIKSSLNTQTFRLNSNDKLV